MQFTGYFSGEILIPAQCKFIQLHVDVTLSMSNRNAVVDEVMAAVNNNLC